MTLKDFLKEKLLFIILHCFLIFFIVNLFKVMDIGTFASGMISFTIILIMVLTMIFEFIKKRNFYTQVYETLDHMEQKQYISQMIEYPNFLDGDVLVDILNQTTKAMNDEIAMYQRIQEEYREFIETWIHEVKIPISCIGLICENNKNEMSKSIMDEINRIDRYVEQALYYARSTNVEKDYSIRQILLDNLVKSVIRKHSKQLIQNKTEIKVENLNFTVFSDPKWLDFILGQVISNSVKYKKEKLKLSFYAKEEENKIVLFILDNGMGIPEKDLKRVFEKGFTGENGRKFAKSTGIGLYLCKSLSEKMHLGFEIDSPNQSGTIAKIVFPKDKAIFFES